VGQFCLCEEESFPEEAGKGTSMKSQPDFDLDWPAGSQSRLWPIRSIRQLMVVVAASGMLLAFTVTLARQPLSSMILWDPGLPTSSTARPRLALYQAPDAAPPLVIACPVEAAQPDVFRPQPRDPLVVVAPESIDPGMVVRAPAWIDPKMVFTPRGGDWQPGQGGLPAPAPGVQGVAPYGGPQYKLVPIPDGRSPRAKEQRRSREPSGPRE